MSETSARRLYTLAWWVGLPLVALYLLWRSLRQREYRRHWGERFLGRGPSFATNAQPDGEVIWVHAVSVGETRAAQPLIEALAAARPQARFVLTHMTPTGRAVGEGLARALPGRVIQRYLPYELPFALRRFLREVRPALGVVMETEVWPNLLFAAQAARVPVALVNARLSEKSLARALRFGALMRAAARGFTRVAAQSGDDRRRLAQLYPGPIDVLGNLKFDIEPAPDLVEQGRALRTASGRAVWLFASTRDGEEALVLDALRTVTRGKMGSDTIFQKMVSDPIFLIVPRHPQRFDEVAAFAAARGWQVVRRADGVPLADTPSGAVHLGDTMGEMALYYAAADVALIGGSVLPFGSQNLIEACACGCPVVLGPSTFNFAQAARDALAAGAAVQVGDARDAVVAMAQISGDAVRQQQMRAAALMFAQGHRGATARTVRLLEALLDAG
jgi:3-deoxy-D-manno-octulosonic-acid transferase